MPKISKETIKKSSEEFKQRMLDYLLDYRLSSAQFAEKVGLSPQVIERATLHGIIPSTRSLIKIADFLNVSLKYLLGETEIKNFYKSDGTTTFQDRIEFLRKERGVKYSQIALTMPFPENLFYEWKRKKSLPSPEYLFAIAKYFNVSPDYLLGRTDERDKFNI